MGPKGHKKLGHALARVSCECGWHFRLEFLRGKSDEDLLLEGGAMYEDHLRLMTEGGGY